MYHLIQLFLLLLTRLPATLNNQVLVLFEYTINNLPLCRHFGLILLDEPAVIEAAVVCTGVSRLLIGTLELKVARLRKSFRVDKPHASQLFLSSLDPALHLVGIIVAEYNVVKQVDGNVWAHRDVAEAGLLARPYEFLKLDLNTNARKIVELLHCYLIRFLV